VLLVAIGQIPREICELCVLCGFMDSAASWRFTVFGFGRVIRVALKEDGEHVGS
jgi:hypothetical protein